MSCRFRRLAAGASTICGKDGGSPSARRRKCIKFALDRRATGAVWRGCTRAARSLEQRVDGECDRAVGAAFARQLGAFSGAGIRLSRLARRPEVFHFVQGEVDEAGRLLDCSEARLELAIGFAQCRFRLDVQMPCEVHDREQEVAHLLEHALMLGLALQLGQFLVDLGPGAAERRASRSRCARRAAAASRHARAPEARARRRPSALLSGLAARSSALMISHR